MQRKIKKICRKYCLCAEIKPDHQALKEEKAFMKGLDRRVAIEMIKRNQRSQRDVIRCIEEVENMLQQ